MKKQLIFNVFALNAIGALSQPTQANASEKVVLTIEQVSEALGVDASTASVVIVNSQTGEAVSIMKPLTQADIDASGICKVEGSQEESFVAKARRAMPCSPYEPGEGRYPM